MPTHSRDFAIELKPRPGELARVASMLARHHVTLKAGVAMAIGPRIFALGAYLGEVVRRNAAGTWRANDQDPQGEVNVELVLADGTKIWPVQRVMKRYENGPEDGIAAYGAAVGLDVGQRPQPPKKRRFFGRET